VSSIRQLLRLLGERYPALAPHLEEGVAVAIDGEIYQDAWLEPIQPESEVHVIPKIAGG
jgi:molybdopterin synthase sulfur carrier subunit